ncbi:YfcZ/YiiS family protein [Otariodibacter oris]|uniref:Uncharacterized protein (TIGR00743 family) n=1 Tax=Otariodibacter oris TaxID=1032623 RepID=A0A420XFU0_9PAST|nr:YfcZ/YiiS family protein [Otariodibacter oris]QGM80236.1 hypothetical protein A6A10_01910 [Otariodibacter oris]RKR71599.1 uncharacterized protein (TIGR00743 family) [Otariodibacter oris]
MTKTLSDQVESCKYGCKPKDTAMFDNEESQVIVENTYTNEEEAQKTLATLVEKARNIESEPCDIQSEIKQVEQGYLLHSEFNFSCQAEAVIFQLSLR